MSEPENSNSGGLLPSGNRGLQLSASGALAKRGLDLLQTKRVASPPSRRIRDLHKAMISACFGAKTYMAEYRDGLPPLLVDERFLFVSTAFAAGAHRSDETFRQNIRLYALSETASHPGFPATLRDAIALVESLPDTLVPTKLTDWQSEDRHEKEIPSSDRTFAHFLRGLLMFVRWHNTRSELPVEVSPSLAALNEFDTEFSPDERAIVCTLNAVGVAGVNGGDFERFLLRSGVKDLAHGKHLQAKDSFEFLLHVQGHPNISVEGRPNPYTKQRVNPKVLFYHALTNALAGDRAAAAIFVAELPDDMRNCRHALSKFCMERES